MSTKSLMTSTTEHLLSKQDAVLGNIIQQVPKPIIHSTHDVFHDLMSCVIEQQIHYRSTKKIFAKALERASITYVTLDNFHLLEKHALGQLKLSSGKYETMMHVIEYWSKNNKDFNTRSDEEIMQELTSINGIGKWSVDMILLYTLQRPNVFPVDDFHLKQIMISLYGLNEKVKLKNQL